jgi:hypothetical protein
VRRPSALGHVGRLRGCTGVYEPIKGRRDGSGSQGGHLDALPSLGATVFALTPMDGRQVRSLHVLSIAFRMTRRDSATEYA